MGAIAEISCLHKVILTSSVQEKMTAEQKLIEVAVIGAGAAGLCAAKHLVHRNQNPNIKVAPVIFEKGWNVGGLWNYDENVGADTHSSIYAGLKTNLPKEIMAFPDYPFPESKHSFLTHVEVKDYLHSYAKHFELEKLI